jgi:hypothetical protein
MSDKFYKQCAKCKEYKPRDEFRASLDRPKNLSHNCKTCRSIDPNAERRCTKCGVTKKSKEFFIRTHRNGAESISSWCRGCKRDSYHRAALKRNSTQEVEQIKKLTEQTLEIAPIDAQDITRRSLTKPTPKSFVHLWDKYRKNLLIYIVQENGTNYIKIGHTANIGQRLLTIDGANPRGITPLLLMYGDEYLELALQFAFSRYHVRKEWFYLSERIENYIEAITNTGFNLCSVE